MCTETARNRPSTAILSDFKVGAERDVCEMLKVFSPIFAVFQSDAIAFERPQTGITRMAVLLLPRSHERHSAVHGHGCAARHVVQGRVDGHAAGRSRGHHRRKRIQSLLLDLLLGLLSLLHLFPFLGPPVLKPDFNLKPTIPSTVNPEVSIFRSVDGIIISSSQM